jgi:hypothetical protein
MKDMNLSTVSNRQFYADDLIDQIAVGYSAVGDMLKRIEQEQDADSAAMLASMARVLYSNAVRRAEEIIAELEKITGKIQVLIDTGSGHTLYDYPVMGIVIASKPEAAGGKVIDESSGFRTIAAGSVEEEKFQLMFEAMRDGASLLKSFARVAIAKLAEILEGHSEGLDLLAKLEDLMVAQEVAGEGGKALDETDEIRNKLESMGEGAVLKFARAFKENPEKVQAFIDSLQEPDMTKFGA